MFSRRTAFVAYISSIILALVLLSSTAALADKFRVGNSGGHTIVSLWVSPSGDRYWGEDLLGDDYLQPGYYVSAYVPGCYADIRILYDNSQVQTRYGFDTCNYNYSSLY